MKKALTLVIALGLVSFLAGGCSSTDEHAEHDHDVGITLCGGCGQVKGTEACCAPGAAKCASCGLAKGSPGCCKMPAGTDAVLHECGAIKGSAACCDENAPRCAGCGKIKGTPGCCIKQ